MSISLSNLNEFKQLVKEELGLDFFLKNELVLVKAIVKRLKANQMEEHLQDCQRYLQRLRNRSEELQALASLLTNNETYFYREPKQLEFLAETLIPHLIRQQISPQPIRILSIGCSSGAEPYSIAIALREKFGAAAAQMFSLYAVDVDQTVLQAARDASYGSMEFRAISRELQQRYFNQSQSGCYVLREEIREMVSFEYMNVVTDSFHTRHHEIDIIFFRNVSIYFDAVTRLSIQKKMVKILKKTGCLIVGMTESMSNDFGLLSLKNQGSVFYFVNEEMPVDEMLSESNIQRLGEKRQKPWSLARKKNVSQGPVIKTQGARGKNRHGPIQLHESQSGQALLTQIEQKIQNKRLDEEEKQPLTQKEYERAIELLNQLTPDSESTTKQFLLQAFILFNRQDFEHARDYALRALDISPFCVDGFLLLGMISKWQEHIDDGIDWFKKALYIHADCWPAHFYLAGLYRQKKMWDKASQEYRLVLKQIAEAQENYTQRLVIPLSFHRADIQLLCRSQLQLMSQLNATLKSDTDAAHGH